jgi:hypothetical protein
LPGGPAPGCESSPPAVGSCRQGGRETYVQTFTHSVEAIIGKMSNRDAGLLADAIFAAHQLGQLNANASAAEPEGGVDLRLF